MQPNDVITRIDDYNVDKNAWSFIDGSYDDNFTIEAVVKKRDTTRNPIISKWPNVASGREWFMWFSSDNPSEVRMGLYDENQNSQISRDTQGIFDNTHYNYVVAAGDYQGGTFNANNIYVYNSSKNESDTATQGGSYAKMQNSNVDVTIGRKGYVTGWYYLNGTVDELRVSDIDRSEDWITTCYNNMWNATDGGFFDIGAYEYTANVEEPTSFVAVTDSSDGSIDLSWVLGLNATHTYIEYNTVSIWTRDDGTFLYNNTGLSTSFTSGSCGVLYYFKGWSWNDTSKSWGTYNTTNNISCPGDPTSVDSVSYPTALNITWTTHGYADSTALIRKSGSYPSGPADGTELYNGTLEYYNDTTIDYDVHKYTIFSWNDTVDRWSEGHNIPTGFLRVSVFDENTSLPLSDWSIQVSNQAGNLVYEQLGCSNPTTIDNSELPTGRCSILINHSDYESRIYYMTIVTAQGHFLNAYLPEKNTTINYYVIQVYNEYNNPLQDVLVTVNEYDNTSGVFQEVSSQYTDGYGQIGLYLVGGKQYKVNLSESSGIYENVTGADYFPDPNYYGIYYPKIFTMQYSTESYPGEETISEVISFNGSINYATHYINVMYTDSMSETVDLQVYVYEYNYTTTTNTLFGTYTSSGSSSFDVDFTNIDNSSRYTVVLFFNHTSFGSQRMSLVFDREYTPPTTQTDTDTLFNLNYGSNPFGWSNFILWLLTVAIYFEGGQQEIGFYMLVLGFILLFVNYQIGFNDVMSTAAGGGIPILHIIIGLGVMWRDSSKYRGVRG